jgi:hypothetical protein
MRSLQPAVIASKAKQSMPPRNEAWIASSLTLLAMTGKKRGAPFPSPLVGEGGSLTRSGGEPDEGSVSAYGVCLRGENPSSGASRHLLPQGEKGRITRRRAPIAFNPHGEEAL